MSKFLSMFAALVLLCCPTLVKAANCTVPNSIVGAKNYVFGGFAYVEFRVRLPIKPSFSFTVTNVATGTQVRFTGVEWMCSIPVSFSPGTPVKAIKNIGQFEGVVTFVIGRCAGSQYISTTQTSTVGGLYRIIKLKFKKCKYTPAPYCSGCQPCSDGCCEDSW